MLLATCNLPGPGDTDLLKSATSLGGGVGHEGDTCGALTGGLLSLGRHHQGGKQEAVYRDSTKFYKKFTDYYGSSKCRDIIGIRLKEGKNIRRLAYKGIICMGVVYSSIGWIFELLSRQNKDLVNTEGSNNSSAVSPGHYIDCANLVLQEISRQSSIDINSLSDGLAGVSESVGVKGDLCCALIAGILTIGLVYGNNPQTNRQTGVDLLKSGWEIMRQGNKAFVREDLHPSFSASRRSAMLYKDFVSRFKSADCKDITKNCNYQEILERYRYVAGYVSRKTLDLI